jgi:hypothetical protein
VEYYTHAEALTAMRYVSGTKLDERIIRCDLDLGYKDGRQFGRGRSGGQVRDEHRQDYDPGRGGWGAQAAKAEADRRREVEERYQDAGTQPVARGGEDWKAQASTGGDASRKRERSPDDVGDRPAVCTLSRDIFSSSSPVYVTAFPYKNAGQWSIIRQRIVLKYGLLMYLVDELDANSRGFGWAILFFEGRQM